MRQERNTKNNQVTNVINKVTDTIKYKLGNTLNIKDEAELEKIYSSIYADIDYIRVMIEASKKEN